VFEIFSRMDEFIERQFEKLGETFVILYIGVKFALKVVLIALTIVSPTGLLTFLMAWSFPLGPPFDRIALYIFLAYCGLFATCAFVVGYLRERR